ncbi:uncharacterized oxidoreductase TM_0325-like [Sitodiplosis mosellana]|uniref:uncharacterized oxidoreductase TM_0325-like n=1 Tax=Sitodiplosis mosellana TaxID=263140 RepID=UPI002443AC20|nr:uncharacterized oxidoreductase TM_0325-like [Sitodiplosis mosellana]
MSFTGKVVIVTGASSGIGADAARHLAKLGAKVSIVGRNEKRLNQVAEQIKSAGSPAPLAIVADVTKDAQRIVDKTIKHFGKLDVLLNNAGIVIQDNVTEINLSEFDRIFDTNVRSVITLTKLSVPYLEKTKGNIVNVSSVAGLKAIPNIMTYCMSKAALDQFTKCSALDLAPKGIRVNSINPAAVRTPIFETFGVNEEQAEKMLEEYKKRYPLGRVGEVHDTSAAIAYLADDEVSSFLTGILLPVDGGSIVAGV